MSIRRYTMDSRVKSLMLRRTNCIHCGKAIENGEPVVTKRSGGGLRRIYCEPCAIDLYLIEEES